MASNFRPLADENNNTTRNRISRLPQDVLGLILETTQSMIRFSERGEGADVSLLPNDETTPPSIVLASHVSRAWRHIAIDFPQMWSSINVLKPWNPGMLAVYLVRSQTYQVALSITTHSENTPMADDLARTAPSLIRSHIHRCRILSSDIDIGFTTLLDGFSHTLRHVQVPVFKQLSLRGEGHHSCTKKYLLYTPALRDLRLGHFGLQILFLPGQITIFHLDAEKISSLHPHDGQNILTVREFFNILAACPLLETLAVYGDLLHFDDQPDVIPLDMSSLRSLQLYGNLMMAPTILLSIAAANLQHLALAPLFSLGLRKVISSRQPSIPVLFPSLK